MLGKPDLNIIEALWYFAGQDPKGFNRDCVNNVFTPNL